MGRGPGGPTVRRPARRPGRGGGRAAPLSPGALATTDHRALLADPSVQAVVIASPNDTHAPLIREAARAGKHVFCEKPIAVALARADAAIAEAARQGVKL